MGIEMKTIFLQNLTGGIFGGILKGLLKSRLNGLFARTPTVAVLLLTAVIAACASGSKSSGPNCIFAEDVGGTVDCGLIALARSDSSTTYNITVGEVLAGQEVNTDKLGLSNFNFTQIIQGDTLNHPVNFNQTQKQLTLSANATALNITISGIAPNVFGNFYLDLVLVDNNGTAVADKVRYTISITPVNDAPVFKALRGSESQFTAANVTTPTLASYRFAGIPFNSPIGYSVGNVSVTDVDSNNNTITYSISDEYSINGTPAVSNTLFEINSATDSATGEITLKVMADADSVGDYTFNVTASDGKGGMTMAEITVSVTTSTTTAPTDCIFAEDVGGTIDCGLIALPQVYNSTTTYNITVGEVLAGQEVNTDKLRSGNFIFTQIINGSISDSEIIFPDNNQIELSKYATHINLSIAADNNVFGEFYIDLVKSDDPTIKIRYTISITAVNDPPTIPVSYDFADIPFNSTAGYSVGNVSATDVDNDATIYGIDGGADDFNLFQVNLTTGEVTLKAIATIEGNLPIVYKFNVTVSDGRGGNARTEITVRVLPDNQAPVFRAVLGSEGQFTEATTSYNFTGIPRNSDIGYLVGNVSATDPDGGAPMYNISDEYNINGSTTASNNDLFQIDSSGGITLIRGAIDNDLGGYTFNVTASDSKGENTTATISVRVLPNEAPVFVRGDGLGVFAPVDGETPANYNFTDVPLGSPVGYSVGNVSATDVNRDAITYTINDKYNKDSDAAEEGNDLFEINPTTGEITLLAGVTESADYTFSVNATDSQNANTTATISVTVGDPTTPIFISTSYIFDLSLSAASARGVVVVVGNVSATDDQETFFDYRLENNPNLFELADSDNADGTRNIILSRAATLSDFAASSTTFQVVAAHNREPSIKSEARITVNLISDSDADGVNDLYDASPLDETTNVTGNGEPGTPYMISNIYQLQAIAGVDHTGMPLDSSDFTDGFLYGDHSVDEQLTKHYVLANDINAFATNTDVWNKTEIGTDDFVGQGWTPIAGNSGQSFSGSFNGDGYQIRDLYMRNRIVNNSQHFALFGINSGNITSVGLINIETEIQALNNHYLRNYDDNEELTSNSIHGYQGAVASLAAFNQESAIISYSYVTGLVNGSGEVVGGLVGANGGELSYSYSTAAVRGEGATGGLVGTNFASSKQLNTYATGDVHAGAGVGNPILLPQDDTSLGVMNTQGNVGGLIGSIASASSIVRTAYALGLATHSPAFDLRVGNIAGDRYTDSTFASLYWKDGVAPGVAVYSKYTLNSQGNGNPGAVGDQTGTNSTTTAQLQGCGLGGMVITGVTPDPTCTDLFPSADWGNTTDSTAGTFDIERGWIFNADEYPSLSAVRSSDDKQLFPSSAEQECHRDPSSPGCE